MKKVKLILIAAIIIAFGMTFNASGQPRTKPSSNKTTKSKRVKGSKTTKYSFGANQTGGGWNKGKNQRKQLYSGPFGLPDIIVSSRKKPQKPKNAKVQMQDLHITMDRRKPRKH